MCSYITAVILFIAVIIGLHYYCKAKEPIFSHEGVSTITKDVLKREKGSSVDKILQEIHYELINEYGDHVLPSSEWLFVNCGGWMGSMYILHASLSEYLMFFGVGIDTSGNSGRYLLNITDTVVSGTMRQWKEGGMTVHNYNVGDTVYHTPGEVTGVQWTSGTIMVEYANGLIPSSLPFALADTFFSTTDFYMVYKILKAYSYAFFNEVIQGNI